MKRIKKQVCWVESLQRFFLLKNNKCYKKQHNEKNRCAGWRAQSHLIIISRNTKSMKRSILSDVPQPTFNSVDKLDFHLFFLLFFNEPPKLVLFCLLICLFVCFVLKSLTCQVRFSSQQWAPATVPAAPLSASHKTSADSALRLPAANFQ